MPRAIPDCVRPVTRTLAQFDGWLRKEGAHIILCGECDTLGVFLLSGGWLELVVAEAVQRALPERPLLELIAKSLQDEPDALLKGLLTVGRGAPRAGLE